ncbi:MAG: ABC transporter ATP-binding protein [Solirubrobacteraceae bacterium]
MPDDANAAAELATQPLLQATGLTRHFRIGGMLSHEVLHAVDGIDFTIGEREIVALVGESGSGKSTVAKVLAGIYPLTSGEVRYRGRSLRELRSRRDLRWYRGEVAMVFQDPFSAFNPVHRISHGILRNLSLHRPEMNAAQRQQEAERVVDSVGLSPRLLSRFPHEMSGGERQRVGFAQALALQARLILADEPVSMLDVSVRAGVLNMMSDLRDSEGVSLLYITHDLASARYVADRIVVMYAGQIAESGPTATVLSRPKHPYTRLLLSAVAEDGQADAEFSGDSGEPPRVINPGEGCRFRFRCPYAIDRCHIETPQPRPIGDSLVACHVAGEDGPERRIKAGAETTTG